MGAAIGASLMGLRPVAEMQFADFITCAFDQIVNFAAKCRYRWERRRPHRDPRPIRRRHSRRPVPFAESRSAVRAHAGPEGSDAPSTAYDAKGLIKSAIRDNDPVLFFEHKGSVPADQGRGCRRAISRCPIGKAAIFREGRDLSIITYGAMVYVALEAAETL